jgi:hypothetical protein
MKNKIVIVILLCILVFTIAKASDVYPNYVRGTVFVSGSAPAPAGTEVTIIVTSGEYKGYTTTVTVDSTDIPPFLRGHGYYDTRDDLQFNTGDTFEVIVDDGTNYGSASGVFYSFGNGAFNSTEVNILISSHKKEQPSGGEGSSGYQEGYNYIVPKPKTENVSTLIEPNAPPSAEVQLPAELAVKHQKAVIEKALTQENSPWTTILIIAFIAAIFILVYSKKRGDRRRG